ncbi:MAG: protein-(glutamine-N5) methyltransferase, release factor-specific [Proteobacteria bacterium]|nr:protein-(glutamine-N5) methyltransferase, release factor-specific [Pseudomonadota bacterium]
MQKLSHCTSPPYSVMPMPTVVEILKKTQIFFEKAKIPSPRLEAELIFCHILKTNRVGIYMKHDMPLKDAELGELRSLVVRRGKREPLAYILGSTGFYEDSFVVENGVLCPRPDTETVVNVALSWIPKLDEKDLKNSGDLFIADIGCGTGCIGLSVIKQRTQTKLYAVDISPLAISCLRKNIELLNLKERVGVICGDLISAIPQNRPIDIVLSNPPYIPSQDINALEPEVALFEPRLALDGGPDGLSFYRRLIDEASSRARIGMIVEVGINQAQDVAQMFEQSKWEDVSIHKDLAGHERVVAAKSPLSS